MPQSKSAWLAKNTLPGIRSRARGGAVHTGPLVSAVPGRTDHHPISVPNGAYVIPADVVSGHGQGNTIAGMAKLKNVFAAKVHAFKHRPRPLTLTRAHEHRAAGGGVAGADDAVPIMAAGGEMVVDPETVAAYGDGNLQKGHAVLDAFVKQSRAKLIKQLKKLPGPVKD